MSDSQMPNVSELLRRARAGDPSGREQLFGLCRSYLGFAARAQVETWLQAKVDASDLVQQTLMEAHRDFARFEGQSQQEWLAWLRKILAHNVADFIRHYRGTAKRQQRREVRFRDPADSAARSGAPEPAARDRSPSQALAQVDAELRVVLALETLSLDHREVIVLRNLERLSFNEVAERMGRSRPAVQMLWTRAIKNLQAAMRATGDSPV